jgi:UPF0716 protein FxsA
MRLGANMPFIIFFLLISLPVIEVASIIQVSQWVGPLVTFLLLAASATFGLFLLRSQSLSLGRRMMRALQDGTPPEKALLDSGMMSLAGVLFMIPGFVTDIIAVLLLIPVARRQIGRWLAVGVRSRRAYWQTKSQPSSAAKPQRTEDVIDVEYTEVPRDAPPEPGAGRARESPWRRPD